MTALRNMSTVQYMNRRWNTEVEPAAGRLVKRFAGVLVVLLGICSMNGCTPAAEPSPQTEVSDRSGMRVVFSQSPGWAEGEGWTVHSDPSVTIGVLNGPEEYQLVDVVAAARRSDGSVVIVDGGSRTVRLYDSRGAYLKTFGGPGSGPGEFTDPGPVLVSAGDSVVVWDNALLRTTRFDPGGNLIGVETVDWSRLASQVGVGVMSGGPGPAGKAKALPEGLYPGAIEPLLDGGFLVRLVEKAGDTPPTGFFRPRSGALRVSEDLSVIDTLAFFGDTEQVMVDAPWGRFPVSPPEAKRSWITHRGVPPRICVGDQGGAEISCFDSGGGRTSIRWVSFPAALTGAEIAQWREATVQLYDLKLNRDQVLEMLDQVPIPDERPAYSQIILDQARNLWVKRGPTAGEAPASQDYLVFDPQGILLGVVSLPPIQVMDIGR